MIISLCNQKGGSARSTTAFNLGAILASQGIKTLCIDFDPQGTLSSFWGIESGGMDEVILEGKSISEITVQPRKNLHIAPADIHLANAEFRLPSMLNREYRLRDALQNLHDEYQVVLIDNQPSLGLLFVNSLAACDQILIVMACDYASLLGVKLLYDSILDVRTQVNPSLEILGLARTRFDGRTLHAKLVSQKAEEMFGDHLSVLNSIINERTAVRDASIANQPIT